MTKDNAKVNKRFKHREHIRGICLIYGELVQIDRKRINNPISTKRKKGHREATRGMNLKDEEHEKTFGGTGVGEGSRCHLCGKASETSINIENTHAL